MSLDMFDAIENEEAAKEVDRKLALAFAIEQADERFGDYLRLSSNLKEFEDRWSTVEKDLVSLATEKVSASPSNIRKIKGALKPTFNQRKASFQKNTWLFSPDLRVYTFEGESAEFTCPNCSSIKTSMGLSRCSCGTLWNAWSVVEGGRKRFLCREIEDRDTILASAPARPSEADSEPAESTFKVSKEEISEDEPYLSAVVREAQRVALAGDTSEDSDDDLFEDGEEMPRKGSSEYFSEIKNSQGKSFSGKVSATEDLRWVLNSYGGNYGFYTLVDLGEGIEIADVGEVDDLEWVASFVDGSRENYFRSKEEAIGWISNEIEMSLPPLNIGPGGRVSNSIMKVTAEEKEYIEGWNSLDVPEDASDAFLEGYKARITSEGK